MTEIIRYLTEELNTIFNSSQDKRVVEKYGERIIQNSIPTINKQLRRYSEAARDTIEQEVYEEILSETDFQTFEKSIALNMSKLINQNNQNNQESIQTSQMKQMNQMKQGYNQTTNGLDNSLNSLNLNSLNSLNFRSFTPQRLRTPRSSAIIPQLNPETYARFMNSRISYDEMKAEYLQSILDTRRFNRQLLSWKSELKQFITGNMKQFQYNYERLLLREQLKHAGYLQQRVRVLVKCFRDYVKMMIENALEIDED